MTKIESFYQSQIWMKSYGFEMEQSLIDKQINQKKWLSDNLTQIFLRE